MRLIHPDHLLPVSEVLHEESSRHSTYCLSSSSTFAKCFRVDVRDSIKTSPSRNAETFPVSHPVLWSFTIW